MFDLFAANAFFGMTVGGGPACFDLDEVQHVALASDAIHFITTMPPVSIEDDEAVMDQPVRSQVFACAADFEMP